MTVTGLQTVDKKRTKVFLDEEAAFVLYAKEIREYGIVLEGELRAEDYEEIMTALLPARAKKRAMNLLKVRPYTERKLREKLTDGGYPAVVIDEALDYVKSYGYVDDTQYAYDYASYHVADKSFGRIRQDLLGKGIAKDLVEETLATVLAETVEENPEEKLIAKELKKKGYDPESASFEEMMKMKAFLYRKGFSQNQIDRSLQKS